MLLATTPTEPRLLLLLKSGPGTGKKIAHQAGMAFYGGRWHSVTHDKPAPKHAPLASHPHAAGQHAPAQHMSAAEWAALALATDNTNAATVNKQLAALKDHSESGNVTAILGSGYGTNSYSQKIVKVANKLLGLHGSKHQVSPGQKAGEHSAVQAVTDLAAGAAPVQALSAATPAVAADIAAHEAATLAMPNFQEGKQALGIVAYYEKVAQQVIDIANAGKVQMLGALKADGLKPKKNGKPSNTWSGKTANSKLLLDLHAKALEHAKAVAGPVQEVKPPEFPPLVYATPEPLVSANAPLPEKYKKIMEGWAADEDKSSLQTMLANNKVTNPHLAAYAEKLLAGMSSPAPAAPPAHDPWAKHFLPDSNTNAASHNKKIAQIKALAQAGDKAGLQALKFGTNSYAIKQKKLAELHIAGIEAFAEPAVKKEPRLVLPVKAGPPALTLEQEQAIVEYLSASNKDVEANQEKYLPANTLFQKLTTDQKSALMDAAAAYVPPSAPAQQSPYQKLLANLGSAQHGAEAIALAHAHVIANGGTEKAKNDAIDAMAAAGFEASALKFSQQINEEPDIGPKNGNTKQGADGMLVFKDGHWHKQEPISAKAVTYKKLAPKEAISIGKVFKTTAGNKATLKAFAVAGDGAGLQAFLTEHAGKAWPASKGYAKALLIAMGAPAIATAVPVTIKTGAPAATAPVPIAPAIEPMDAWQQTGPQGGSNPGGRYKDAHGAEWYCKFPANEDIAKSEVLAAKLYAAAGVEGQHAKLITKGGKVGIASKWVDVHKAGSPAALAKLDGARSGFAVDAWLGNWDVVGLGYDNLQVGPDGKAIRIDAGGSLEYRAQGAKKPFGTKVDEITTLRDAKTNPQSAAVFGSMTEADISASVAKIAKLDDPQIRALVEEFGPGDKAARKAMAETLIARRNDLTAKYPQSLKATKKHLDPKALPVKPERLPKRHDFANWNGPGQGLSSKAHINAANQSVENEMTALAKTGNLPALKAFKYHAIDKETGNQVGSGLPIANHPSKHVVQLHSDLATILEEIANPPEPLKVFQETDVGTLAALDAAFPPKPFGTSVNAVASNEKMGFWVALGVAKSAIKLAPKKTMDFSSGAIAAAKAKFHDAPALAKHFISSVQSSGSYNDLFRAGKKSDNSGNSLVDVAHAALAYATSQPEGTSLYRWQNMSDAMVKQIMAVSDGTVFQATGPMCTSYSPEATSGFGAHRVIIRYAKGAKAVESFGSGKFLGEKEVTTLPNSRFVILSKKMVTGKSGGTSQRLELEVLMLPPDIATGKM